MQAFKTNLKLEDMPDSLKELRLDIESQIPCGIPEKTNMYKGRFKEEDLREGCKVVGATAFVGEAAGCELSLSF